MIATDAELYAVWLATATSSATDAGFENGARALYDRGRADALAELLQPQPIPTTAEGALAVREAQRDAVLRSVNHERPDLAELRRLAEAARDLPAGSDWLHGEVADGTETVAEWMGKCSAEPDALAAGRLRLVWAEGSGETKVIVQAIVGDNDTAPIRAAFMANANPSVVLALLDAAAERDALAASRAACFLIHPGGAWDR